MARTMAERQAPARGEAPVGVATLADRRPRAVAQRRIADALDGAPALARLRAVAAMLNGSGVVQRQVLRVRKGDNSGKWYTDREPDVFYDTPDEAARRERALVDAEISEHQERKDEKRTERRDLKRKAMEEKHKDYKPPATGKARLFKSGGKAHDDVNIVSGNSGNIKEYAEKIFEKRQGDAFSTEVLALGGGHYALTPGTDIGMVPAEHRPDLGAPEGLAPMSREGQPQSYDALASGLDKIAERHATKQGHTVEEGRSRVGKDMDRASRGNAPQGSYPYTPTERAQVQEMGTLLRLDKGRARNATRSIRHHYTSGKNSFKSLAGGKYPGAQTGGAARLRAIKEEDGHVSEGSDIEEEREKKRRKLGEGEEEQKQQSPALEGDGEVAGDGTMAADSPPAEITYRRPPPVNVESWPAVDERSWNAGDEFTVGEGPTYVWTVNHIGGTGLIKGEFRIRLRGG